MLWITLTALLFLVRPFFGRSAGNERHPARTVARRAQRPLSRR